MLLCKFVIGYHKSYYDCGDDAFCPYE